jgi:hypothetical protein
MKNVFRYTQHNKRLERVGEPLKRSVRPYSIGMKKKIIVVGLLILLFGAGYRIVHVFPYPMSGGKYRESPDKQFTASASSMTDRFFFGGQRRYYEFEIEDGSHNQIRRIVIDEPKEGLI